MQAEFPKAVLVQFTDLPNENRTDWKERGANFCLFFMRSALGYECRTPEKTDKDLQLVAKTNNVALQWLAGLMAIVTLPLTLLGLIFWYASNSHSDASEKAKAIVFKTLNITLEPGLQISANLEALRKDGSTKGFEVEADTIIRLLHTGQEQAALDLLYREQGPRGKAIVKALMEKMDSGTALSLMQLVTERHIKKATSTERLAQDLSGDLTTINQEADAIIQLLNDGNEDAAYERLKTSMLTYGKTLGEALMNKMGVREATTLMTTFGNTELQIANLALNAAKSNLQQINSLYPVLLKQDPEKAPLIKMAMEAGVTKAEQAIATAKQLIQIVSQCLPNQDLSSDSIGSLLIREFYTQYTKQFVYDNMRGPFYSNIVAALWKNKGNSESPPSVDQMIGIVTSIISDNDIFNNYSTPERKAFLNLFAAQFNRRFVTTSDQKVLRTILARMIINHACDFISTLHVADQGTQAAIAENGPKVIKAFQENARLAANASFVPLFTDLVAE